ncbi:MAG TPA: glutamate--tRNA ligase family protein [Candidatus Angelobacter sp.]|nr:glutamate--tRNA ligase family protein [Candidatus Angelobacter sp.]
MASPATTYRGRIAPSPTGYLHLGHARTFWVAFQRSRRANGQLIFRNEDLDFLRCKPEFAQAMIEDLRWLGLDWEEGPDVGGPHAPYIQSQRRTFFLRAWRTLRNEGWIYPCSCSRKDLERTRSADAADDDDEIPYRGTCRNEINRARDWESPAGVSWRFRVPDGEAISFADLGAGAQRFVAGKDFTDFLVWRRDDIPSYQLAVVADDAEMLITEVVRGADLLKSTARQLLLLRALNLSAPRYFHCPLVRDEHHVRLAKRYDSLSLRALRAQGNKPEQLLNKFAAEIDWAAGLE